MSLPVRVVTIPSMTSKTEIPAEIAARRVQELRAEIERKRHELDQLSEELDWWFAGRKFFDGQESNGGKAGAGETEEGKPTLRRAILRVMNERPTSTWAAERVIDELGHRRWLPNGKNAEHTVRSMLANMKNQGQLKRVARGRYRLAPSEDEA
jgi:hypothetical protein